eukprot:tig00001409_g8620.t1
MIESVVRGCAVGVAFTGPQHDVVEAGCIRNTTSAVQRESNDVEPRSLSSRATTKKPTPPATELEPGGDRPNKLLLLAEPPTMSPGSLPAKSNPDPRASAGAPDRRAYSAPLAAPPRC